MTRDPDTFFADEFETPYFLWWCNQATREGVVRDIITYAARLQIVFQDEVVKFFIEKAVEVEFCAILQTISRC